MDEKMQYDYAVGGNQKLPSRVTMFTFTAERINEIKEMEQALKTTTATKLAFQQLPKHMRRRVMAHNSKRLPRRIKEKHLSQLRKSGMPSKQKRPSRKHRRRPRNLSSEYANRQRRIKWLETHLWHAKRFHMTEKWGFRIASKPCDKAFRACYRATAKHCLIQDVSYIKCIELKGNRDAIINILKSTSINNGLSVGAKAYLSGSREGTMIMLCNDRPLGSVNFHWGPSVNEKDHMLWLWVHAAYYTAVLSVLTDAFKLLDQVQVMELSNSLNRFKLTGPLSLAVLYNSCKTVSSSNSKWFCDYVKIPKNLSRILEQHNYWHSVYDSADVHGLSPRHILCLTVDDPRYHTPRTKTKALLKSSTTKKHVDLPQELAFGAIWDSDTRRYVKENKISNAALNELRSELLVPGTSLTEGEAVPIMLVQNPGSRERNLGYSSGWDLIVPAGWGNAFWQTLVMWGARAGGLREFNNVLFESGQLPLLAPDTPAGNVEEQQIEEAHRKKYFALPPNKRPNYNKLSVVKPFAFDWMRLINEWNADEKPAEHFWILRDKGILNQLQVLLKSNSTCCKRDLDSLDNNFLIPVFLRVQKQGTVKQFARICMPEPDDLETDGVFEPKRADPNQSIRKEKRCLHRKLLRKLRSDRKKKRKRAQVPTERDELIEYAKEMRELWLPDTAQLRTSSSRSIMGYVVHGDFSFTQSCCCGVGYITIGGFKTLLQQRTKNKVLVRNISCLRYRVANIEIVA